MLLDCALYFPMVNLTERYSMTSSKDYSTMNDNWWAISRFTTKSDYLIGQNFGGQNCRKSDMLPKILSGENFCLPKIFSAEIFCPLKSKTCQINTNLMLKHIFLVNCMVEIRNRWKNFVGQNCRNFDLVTKILSAENFCPPKILSAVILSDYFIASLSLVQL